MPHKVNPINFENSEANLGISNSLFEHLTTKLPISRLQRDLSDSSALRNVGPAVGHSLVGMKSAIRGLSRVEVDKALLSRELDEAWEVLTEAVQTVMRKHGFGDAYEQLKSFSRGKAIDQEGMRNFIISLALPEADKARLAEMTPSDYTGIAGELVGKFL